MPICAQRSSKSPLESVHNLSGKKGFGKPFYQARIRIQLPDRAYEIRSPFTDWIRCAFQSYQYWSIDLVGPLTECRRDSDIYWHALIGSHTGRMQFHPNTDITAKNIVLIMDRSIWHSKADLPSNRVTSLSQRHFVICQIIGIQAYLTISSKLEWDDIERWHHHA